MKKVTDNIRSCQDLCNYMDTIYPQTAENLAAGNTVRLVGTWTDIDPDQFLNKPVSTINTTMHMVRAWSDKWHTFWTVEIWQHSNGYKAYFKLINKGEFISLINS